MIGYVFGLFQTAYLYGKLHGIDIRNYGSGNAGTTNTLRTLGTKAGLIVLLGDIMKCILAIVLTNMLFRNSHPDEIYLLKIYAAALFWDIISLFICISKGEKGLRRRRA